MIQKLKAPKHYYGPYYVVESNESGIYTRIGEKLARVLGYEWLNFVQYDFANHDIAARQNLLGAKSRLVISVAKVPLNEKHYFLVDEYLGFTAKDEYECIKQILSQLVQKNLYC